ncbi:ABC transporter ATP-binding protein [Oceaniovalibus sp. ACAM 378]|uniref:ABC transporter ATP-binding protein n=1 Tax=Oceaniovalibus sp. ACAM 378 TaxID=2599923 RepID=UPI0011DB1751|nr:ABC transporter ATP-binding protein [Oceaniovalibus sp. ACAM 378]TYB87883.1 ABC transporter ATP-binding protein [Oceaniovalibus sp. ACAM 378]
MPSPFRLEEFDGPGRTTGLPDLESLTTPPEQDALAAFDKGYAAGWEDAAKATRQEQEQSKTAVAQSLQDLGFTYQEARAHVMRSLTPLVSGMLTRLLPRLIRDTLGARIIEEIDGIADKSADSPIDLLIAPAGADDLRTIIGRITELPLRVVEEATVPEGQIFLRLGLTEREIDLSGALDSISAALNGLDSLNRKESVHG